MIEIQHLTKQYGDHIAVSDLTASIEAGQIYGFLGPNGAGKSTTMNIITGCLAATSGTVTIDGYDIFEQPQEAKRRIGYLPELPPLYQEMTVQEYLLFVAELKGTRKKADRAAAVEHAAARAGLQGMEQRLIRNLSKGYRQRVGIAAALLGTPKIIILDEPTAMLDPNGRKEVLEAVRELNRKEKVTVILITHYMEEVIHADRVYVMDSGNVVMQGNPKEIFSQVDTLKAYGLDVPQVTLLAYELKKSGVDVPDGILTTEELVSALCQSN